MPSQFQTREKRCTVLPGFPREDKFQSKEDVEYYFNGDRIQCLLCGKWYRQINNHHLKLHNTTIDEYKERFGLPWRKGLCSCKTHDIYHNLAVDKITDGTIDIFNLADKYRHLAHAAKQREKPAYQIKDCTDRIKGKKKPYKYPFHKMGVKNSVFIPYDNPTERSRISCAVRNYGNKNNKKFICKKIHVKDKDGIKVGLRVLRTK